MWREDNIRLVVAEWNCNSNSDIKNHHSFSDSMTVICDSKGKTRRLQHSNYTSASQVKVCQVFYAHNCRSAVKKGKAGAPQKIWIHKHDGMMSICYDRSFMFGISYSFEVHTVLAAAMFLETLPGERRGEEGARGGGSETWRQGGRERGREGGEWEGKKERRCTEEARYLIHTEPIHRTNGSSISCVSSMDLSSTKTGRCSWTGRIEPSKISSKQLQVPITSSHDCLQVLWTVYSITVQHIFFFCKWILWIYFSTHILGLPLDSRNSLHSRVEAQWPGSLISVIINHNITS